MLLKEYLDEVGIPITVFAKKVGTCPATIHNILHGNRDLRLSIAVKIEETTKGLVKCKDLLPRSKTVPKKHKDLKA